MVLINLIDERFSRYPVQVATVMRPARMLITLPLPTRMANDIADTRDRQRARYPSFGKVER